MDGLTFMCVCAWTINFYIRLPSILNQICMKCFGRIVMASGSSENETEASAATTVTTYLYSW